MVKTMPMDKEMQIKDYFQDGQLFFERRLYSKALSSLHQAYILSKELGKDDFQLNLLIGRTFYAQKDYSRAKRVFAELAELKTEDETVKLYLAHTYYYTIKRFRDLPILEDLVAAVLKLNDKNINALELRADIYMHIKDYASALGIYKKIEPSLENPYRIIYKEAICSYHLKNFDETLRLCTHLFEAGFKKHPGIIKLHEAAKGK